MRWLFANPVLGLRPCIYGELLSQVERSPTYPSQLFIHLLITRGEPFYCAFHKYANSKVQKTPSQLRFSLPSIIITIISNEPWNTETHKRDRNPPITHHKPWPFEPVKVKFCFLRGPLRWLTAAKNAIVSWLSNFRIRMFVKSAVMTKKKLSRLDGSHSCRGQLDQNETIENSSFTYTANGKRQIQVENFLK